VWADALIRLHVSDDWEFTFDNAKTRAGLCNYTHKRISVSKYLAARYEDDEIYQVLLHEIAHAMAGPGAGHGPEWKVVACELGYEGKRLHGGAIADEFAPWVGTCAAGHQHFRYRKPTRVVACGLCSRRFSAAHRIEWVHRTVSRPRA